MGPSLSAYNWRLNILLMVQLSGITFNCITFHTNLDSRQKVKKAMLDVKPSRRFKPHHPSDAENLPDLVDNVKKGVVAVIVKSCQFCPTKCSTREEFKVHMRNSHRDQLKYKCDFCNFSSNFNAGIAYHLKTTHSDLIRVDEEAISHTVLYLQIFFHAFKNTSSFLEH